MSSDPQHDEITGTRTEFSPTECCSYDDPGINSCETFPEAWEQFFGIIRERGDQDHTTLANVRTALAEISTRIDSDAYDAAQEDLTKLSLATQKLEMFRLLEILPERMKTAILRMAEQSASVPKEGEDIPVTLDVTFYSAITEIDVHLGQKPRIYFNTSRSMDLPFLISDSEINDLQTRLCAATKDAAEGERIAIESRSWGTDLRIGVPGTLHRVGLYLNKTQSRILGCSMRIGRHIPFAGALVADLMMRGSVLIVAPPCSGKTTVLRDAITRIANTTNPPRLVVVDTSDEIVGDSDYPAPYLAAVRRLHVRDRSSQNTVLIQAVQNHSPEIVVVDELATSAECEGVCTIMQRGCRVLCSVHGQSLVSVMHNKQLNKLLGGAQSIILSSKEKSLKGKDRKTVVERVNPIPFQFALEMTGKTYGKGILYVNLDTVVDKINAANTDTVPSGGYVVDLMKPVHEQECHGHIRGAL